ncbi:hypothetical protein NPIL_169191, partial [Nephila pilipes]
MLITIPPEEIEINMELFIELTVHPDLWNRSVKKYFSKR